MNVISGSRARINQLKAVTLLTKQSCVVIEQGGVAIRIKFDKVCKKFAIEDLTEADAQNLTKSVSDGILRAL